MSFINLSRTTAVVVGLVLLLGGQAIGHVRTGQQGGLPAFKPTVIDRKQMDVNQIRAWYRNDGEFFFDHGTNGAGFEWPKTVPFNPANASYAIFSSSMWIGARVWRYDGLTIRRPIRVATVGHGASEHRPGKILEDGTPDDWTLPKYRFYRVRPLLDTPADPDFREWPAADGAPFFDANGDGRYDPFVGDRPALMWAGQPVFPDMLMWAVYNDADPAAHNHRWGQSRELGVEVRQTVWAFERAGPLGDMVFMKFDVYNKGVDTLRDAYMSVWSDPDIGAAFDRDLVAVDTTLKLAIVYKGVTSDPQYPIPPSVGYVYLQGPRVFTGNPADIGRWNGVLQPGFRELGITGFNFYCNPGTGGCREDFHDPDKFVQAYNVMRGLTPKGEPWIDPITQQVTSFVFSGDPVTGTGWLQDRNWPEPVPPTDVRFTMTSGPFVMIPGDSQQVVVGVLVGQGSSNINSVSVLRENTQIAQTLYDNEFQLPEVPPVPELSWTWDGNSLLLRWGNEAESWTNQSDSGIVGNWKFHAYEIFQLGDVVRTPTTPEVRLNSYYRIGGYGPSGNDTLRVLRDSISVGGERQWAPVWEGQTLGWRNQIVLSQDALKQKPFIPGRPYYFYIRTHGYSDAATTTSGFRHLASAIRVVTVVPRNPVAGTQFQGQIGNQIPHSRWVSPDYYDDAVRVEIIDPARATAGRYKITFNGSGANVTGWNLHLLDLDSTVSGTNFSGDDFYPIVSNGVMPKIIRRPPGVRRDSQTPRGWIYTGPIRWFTGHTAGNFPAAANPFPMDAFNAFAYPRGAPGSNFVSQASGLRIDSLRRIEIRFSSTNTQKAYRYVERVRASLPPQPPVHPEYVPYILNRGVGYTYQDFQRYPLGDPANGVTVPFTVWEVDPLYRTNRQLAVGIVERNDTLYKDTLGVRRFVGYGKVDGKWDPLHTVIELDEDERQITRNPSREGDEVIFIFAVDYSEDPETRFTGTTTPLNLRAQMPNLPIMYVVWLRKILETSTWRDGDVLILRPNYALSATHEFDFQVQNPTIASPDIARAREDLKRIRVVPNPYYGTHELQRHQLDTYVTFMNLPADCTIRIFNLAGEMVRVINHTSAPGQFDNSSARWDLKNHREIPIASGMYLAHIDAPGIGEHVVKFAVFIQQERLERF